MTINMFCGLVFCASSAFGFSAGEGFPAVLYDEAHPKNEADSVIQIKVNDKEHLTVPVHSYVFNDIESLKLSLNGPDSKAVPYNFPSEEAASAFKKVIYFQYQYSARKTIETTLFESHDLLELILLALEHKIDALSRMIEEFLRGEVNLKLANPRNTILLDELTKEEAKHLFEKFVYASEAIFQDHLMEHIKIAIVTYAHFMKLYTNDLRFDSSAMDPDFHKHLCDLIEKIEIERDKEDFEEQAQKIVAQIYDKFRKSTSAKKGVQPRTYWPKKKFAKRVATVLKNKFRNFDVVSYPNFPDLGWGSNLHSLCNEVCSMGSCLAQGMGWIGWVLLYPCQLATCNFCIPYCSDPADRMRSTDGCCGSIGQHPPEPCFECWCGTQSGAVIATGLYNMATCCHRPVYIKPKKSQNAELNILLKPPVEPQEMKR